MGIDLPGNRSAAPADQAAQPPAQPGSSGKTPARVDLRSLSHSELCAALSAWGEPSYRTDQLLQWIYARRVAAFKAMTNLPQALRQRLEESFDFTPLALIRVHQSDDGTRKFLWRLGDGSLIESVVMAANPALYGEVSDRHTLCVSTQVGCAYGCRFCASGMEGWKRNLSVAEIVDQYLAVERWRQETPEVGPAAEESASPRAGTRPDERWISNLVIMGMGEPLANYDNLMKALAVLNAPWGGALGARKITVSTSGLAPQIRRLAEEAPQYRLAVSLHGATDSVRDRIMPVNRKHPIRELAAACEYYQEKKGRMITLEYILIEGVNDGMDQVLPLANLARRLRAKVNLIPYNQVEGLPWRRPAEASQEAFLSGLERAHVAVTLRREKGHDIAAACGQLRLRVQREEDAAANVSAKSGPVK